MRVEHAIDETIRELVLRARNVRDIEAVEVAQQRHRTAIERLELRVLHAILAEELLDDELGVETYGEVAHAAINRGLEADAERVPLGHVVRGNAEIHPDLGDERAVGGDEHGPARCRPRIPPRSAVGKEGDGCLAFRGRMLPMRAIKFHRLLVGLVAAGAMLLPQVALAANVFYGEVLHVSTTNVKVRDPHTGQILSFELLPHFDQVFSDDGKTTYQMKYLHDGRYVAVIYDQKALGIRHADKIFIMNNANERLRRVGGSWF